ncbi:hypothetical protein DSO57_1026215 [Entomophthora muscae]|uniref:Uncharacterized protein n=1 Tax=Entomophthora muscae TaxID=34485 RepID=A0ACC2T273_9FUNG|nr:hypothetical protein DSO57_1026215 [Entomophthora muscae]
MKYTIAFLILGLVGAEKCLAPTDGCGPVFNDPSKDWNMGVSLYSAPDFKGDVTTVKVNGPYGCTNDVPFYAIRSLLSTATTKVVLHYGRDCVGHVLEEFQGGSQNVNITNGCPMSVFVKFHRHGSC